MMRLVAAAALALVLSSAPALAEPPSTPALSALTTWLVPAEARPLDCDLDAGISAVDRADARLTKLDGELGRLLPRKIAVEDALTKERRTLAELRAARKARSGDNDDGARALDAKIAATNAQIELLRTRLEVFVSALGHLSDEAKGLMEGMMRAGEVGGAVSEDTRASAAKKRKAAVLVKESRRGYEARMRLVRTIMGATRR